MAKAVRPIPEGQHSITPYLVVRGASQAIDFYKKAFGAVDKGRMPGPDGKSIVHAEIKIGDSFFYLSDEFPGGSCKSPQSLGGCTCTIHLYVEDADAVFDPVSRQPAYKACAARVRAIEPEEPVPGLQVGLLNPQTTAMGSPLQ